MDTLLSEGFERYSPCAFHVLCKVLRQALQSHSVLAGLQEASALSGRALWLPATGCNPIEHGRCMRPSCSGQVGGKDSGGHRGAARECWGGTNRAVRHKHARPVAGNVWAREEASWSG